MAYSGLLRNILLGCGLLIAIVASTYKLSEAPAIWYDEGFYSQMAMNFASLGKQVIQTAPDTYSSTSYVAAGYAFIAPVSLAYKIFGTGVTQGRAVMVLFLLGCIGFSYFLVRKMFNQDIAALSLLLLATFPMLYGNGKAVLGEVPGLFFLFLTLLALYYLEQSNYQDWKRYVYLGLAAGLCIAAKMFFILLIGAFFFTYLLRVRSIRVSAMGFVFGVCSFVLPLLLWGMLQFGAEASLGSVLSYYSNPYAVEDVPQHILQNAKRLITEVTPLFTTLLIMLWGISLYLRRKEKIFAAEVSGFIFCLLVLVSYLRLEGWYRYLFPATVVALVFLPSAALSIYSVIRRKIIPRDTSNVVALAVLILLAAAQLYQTAFSSYVAQYHTGTRTEKLTEYLPHIGDKSVLLYNTPELAVMLPTKNYYQYLTPLPNVTIGKESLLALKAGVPDIVIVSSTFDTNSDPLFITYKERETVDRYTVLKRK